MSCFDHRLYFLEIVIIDIFSFRTDEHDILTWCEGSKLILSYHDANSFPKYLKWVGKHGSIRKEKIRSSFSVVLYGKLYRNSDDIDFFWENFDRKIFGKSAIDELSSVMFIGCKYSRNADRSTNRIDDTPFSKNNFLSRIDIGCDDYELDFGFCEGGFSEVLLEEA